MSTAKLKPLEKQVIVITDAASDIGRATALLAAGRGAKVVVSARNEEAGSKIAEEINAGGGEAVHIPCNMADRGQVEELVATALDRFGYIDTWINTSELAICSRLDEISEEDSRRLFDANFWGIYHGSLAILPHLKRYGGALINLGSEISESVVPCQGIYSAAKYAVKGFVDTLRLEVEELEHAPVSITLIQPPLSPKSLPARIQNHQPSEPNPPDAVTPRAIAEAILEAAETPVRSKKVTAEPKINPRAAGLLPNLREGNRAQDSGEQSYVARIQAAEGILSSPGMLVSTSSTTCESGAKTI